MNFSELNTGPHPMDLTQLSPQTDVGPPTHLSSMLTTIVSSRYEDKVSLFPFPFLSIVFEYVNNIVSVKYFPQPTGSATTQPTD